MSKRFELINFLNAHDDFKDNKKNEKLDSFDVVRLLNHYDELQTLLVEKDQRIAELEEQLKNYIKPKFKLKQCAYYIFDGFVGIFKPEYVTEVRDVCIFGIEIYEDGIKYATSYGLFNEEDLFATKEEALAKLEELKGNNYE